jgi:protein O-GlcNAc transferase
MAEWVARGRAHQFEKRAADALPCFRRAIREDPASPLPHFHLGEALWQLGLKAEAVVAWHRSARLDSAFLPPRQALSEAAMLQGDFANARVIASEAIAAAPQNERAQAADIAAAAAMHDPVALARCAELVERVPSLVQVPAIANAMVSALATADPDARSRLYVALAKHADHAQPALLATLVELGSPVAAELAHRTWAPGDADPLRRIAIAAGTPTLAAKLAGIYSSLTASRAAPPVPLLWPRRTGGRELRVAWIVPALNLPAWADWIAALASMRLPPDARHVVMTGDAAAVRKALAATQLATAAMLAMPVQPDVEVARALAARDCDVLVDAAGLSLATGPLLAMRPARRILSLPTGAPEHGPPLVDARVADGVSLAKALDEVRAAIVEGGSPSVDALMERWDAAIASHQVGEIEAASAGYSEILREQPAWAPAWQLMGNIAGAAGRLDEARAAYDAALAAAPNFVEARISAAELAVATGDVPAAIGLAREGVARAPRDVGLWRVLGQAELARGDGKAAEAAFARALQFAPAAANLHLNHGLALQMAGEREAASRAWQRALTFDPDMIAADFNLGLMFAQSGNVDAAVAAFNHVLGVDPGHVAAWKSLGETLFAGGRIDAWLANFDRFRMHCPNALPLAVYALEAGAHRADFALIETTLDGLREDRFVAASAVEHVDCLEELLYLLLFVDVEPELMLALAQRYDSAAREVYGAPMARSTPRNPGPWRIGYLSADLRNHVMGKMMWQAIAQHDRTQFEVHLYSMSSARDEWTERFAANATRFSDVSALGDAAAAAHIAADDLDVLVDLATHTRGARPGILARKPARVQITHVASAGTLGLSAIDFKLTDHFADLPANEAFQIERMLPMNGCVYPFRYIAPTVAHLFDRVTLGIAADAFVIGAFVTPLKLSRRCLALWGEVLQRIPRAVLAFSPANPALRGSYQRLAGAVGIGEDRIVFIPQGRDDSENQARYRVVDIVLDTMPFGGVNGTLEALAMLVPVVTLVGRRHGERTTYSILANLGVTETVAQSGREYVGIAQRLADDPVFRGEVKARIAAGIEDSPLVDMEQHARNLEAAYMRALLPGDPASSAR